MRTFPPRAGLDAPLSSGVGLSGQNRWTFGSTGSGIFVGVCVILVSHPSTKERRMGFLDKLLGRSKKAAQQGMGAADRAADRAREEVDEHRHAHDEPGHTHDEPTPPAGTPE